MKKSTKSQQIDCKLILEFEYHIIDTKSQINFHVLGVVGNKLLFSAFPTWFNIIFLNFFEFSK